MSSYIVYTAALKLLLKITPRITSIFKNHFLRKLFAKKCHGVAVALEFCSGMVS